MVGGHGPSFPSGHVMASVALWGLMPLVVGLLHPQSQAVVGVRGVLRVHDPVDRREPGVPRRPLGLGRDGRAAARLVLPARRRGGASRTPTGSAAVWRRPAARSPTHQLPRRNRARALLDDGVPPRRGHVVVVGVEAQRPRQVEGGHEGVELGARRVAREMREPLAVPLPWPARGVDEDAHRAMIAAAAGWVRERERPSAGGT